MHQDITTTFHTLKDRDLKLLVLRLIILVIMVALMTLHMRSVRVFRWEQTVSGGVLATYCVAALGLALCADIDKCGGKVLQVYLSGTGAVLLAVNAIVIWQRWRRAGELTRIVAELLQSLGVQLARHVKVKVLLSAVASIALILDLILALVKK